MHDIKIERVYDPLTAADGYRVLVDRLWPRGVSKVKAALDEWARDVAPSAELRKSFAHQEERFDEFRTAYRDELDRNQAALEFAGQCREKLMGCDLVLIYAARNRACNNAVVLREWLQEHMIRLSGT